jgi:hypothetical protein
MFGAVTRDPAWQDLTSFSDVSFQAPDVLVIDVLHFIDTEVTDLPSPAESSFHIFPSCRLIDPPETGSGPGT